MTIEIKDPNGVKLVTLQLNQRDSEISQGRRTIIRSIATKYDFLTGIAMRKDGEGKSYLEIKMKPETKEAKLPILVRELVDTLI